MIFFSVLNSVGHCIVTDSILFQNLFIFLQEKVGLTGLMIFQVDSVSFVNLIVASDFHCPQRSLEIS